MLKLGQSHNQLSQPSSDSLGSANLVPVNPLQAKVAALGSGQAQKVDWFELIASRLAESTLELCLPETLVVEIDGSKRAYITREGGVMLSSGETAETDFFAAASACNQQLRNLNPAGIRYPKFLSFKSGTLECTFPQKKAIKEYLRETQGPFTLQRYIIPQNYTVKKHIIHWRRTKPVNVYVLTSRSALQSAKLEQGRETEYAFVVSSHCVGQYDVAKEGLGETQVPLLETVRTVLEQTLKGRIEEFAFESIKSQDGKWYIVDVPWVKGPISPVFPSIPSPTDLSRELLQRLCQKPVPEVVSHDQLAASISCYDHSRLCKAWPVSLPSPALSVSHRLQQISSKLDHIRSESLQLKQEASLIMKLSLPKEVLTGVIHRVYENVLRDPRLSRYYMDKSRVYTKLEGAVRRVFQCGPSRILKTRIKAIHAHMGITEHDFELYLRYFAEAVLAEGLSSTSVDLTIRFLTEFKAVVVQTS